MNSSRKGLLEEAEEEEETEGLLDRLSLIAWDQLGQARRKGKELCRKCFFGLAAGSEEMLETSSHRNFCNDINPLGWTLIGWSRLFLVLLCLMVFGSLSLESGTFTSEGSEPLVGTIHRMPIKTVVDDVFEIIGFRPGPTDIDYVDEKSFLKSLAPPKVDRKYNLPRTTRRPYNKPVKGKKYILYTPQGSFFHQLYSFMNAIYLGKKSGRGVLVPPFSVKTSNFYDQEQVQVSDIIPMDQVIDFEYVERAMDIDLVPLDVPLHTFRTHPEFLGMLEEDTDTEHCDVLTLPLRKIPGLLLAKIQLERETMIETSPKQIVFLLGTVMNTQWLSAEIQSRVRLSPYFRMFSKAISTRVLGPRFNAILLKNAKQSVKVAANLMELEPVQSALNKSAFFVAADIGNIGPGANPFKARIPNTLNRMDVLSNPVLQDWLDDFEARGLTGAVMTDLMDCVDLLLCTRAEMLFGAQVSSATDYLFVTRSALGVFTPDMVGTEELATRLVNGERHFVRNRTSFQLSLEGRVRKIRKDEPASLY